MGGGGGYVGRLAPSPTGALHLGNARTFLIAYLAARHAGGRLIYRLEDLDHPKVKPEAASAVIADLEWLGLDWDSGGGRPGEHAPYVQSERKPLYAAALTRLLEAGLVYPCTCSRRDVENAQSAPHAGEELRYPGTCRDRYPSVAAAAAALGRPPALRFRVAPGTTHFRDGFLGDHACDLMAASGDFVVARGMSEPGYQLAVVVDDAAMGITEVVRGDDLAISTHRQLALYAALGLTVPSFVHVPLVVGSDGRRLAKRHGDTRLATLRERGVAAATIVGWLAATCGWLPAPRPVMPRDLVERFDLSTIPAHPCVLDAAALTALGAG